MNEDDTFMKLRLGHLELKRDALVKQVNSYRSDQGLDRFEEYRTANKELMNVHSEMIAILVEEAEKIDKEIERIK